MTSHRKYQDDHIAFEQQSSERGCQEDTAWAKRLSAVDIDVVVPDAVDWNSLEVKYTRKCDAISRYSPRMGGCIVYRGQKKKVWLRWAANTFSLGMPRWRYSSDSQTDYADMQSIARSEDQEILESKWDSFNATLGWWKRNLGGIGEIRAPKFECTKDCIDDRA